MMKKFVFTVAFFALFIYGCNSKTVKVEQEKAKQKEVEILANDSISDQLENITTEIESSALEADSLLNEL